MNHLIYYGLLIMAFNKKNEMEDNVVSEEWQSE